MTWVSFLRAFCFLFVFPCAGDSCKTKMLGGFSGRCTFFHSIRNNFVVVFVAVPLFSSLTKYKQFFRKRRRNKVDIKNHIVEGKKKQLAAPTI